MLQVDMCWYTVVQHITTMNMHNIVIVGPWALQNTLNNYLYELFRFLERILRILYPSTFKMHNTL